MQIPHFMDHRLNHMHSSLPLLNVGVHVEDVGRHGHNLILGPFSFSLTSNIYVDGLPGTIAAVNDKCICTNETPSQHNYCTAHHHHHNLGGCVWRRVLMLNDNSSRVSGYITLGLAPPA